MLPFDVSPSIATGSANPEILAGLAGIADFLGMLQHSKFTLNVTYFVRTENVLRPKPGSL